MKKILILLFIILSINTMYARNDRDTLGLGATILFSENRGQWADNVLFRSQMNAATLFVESDRFTFVVQHPDNDNLHHPAVERDTKKPASTYRTHSYQLLFEGGNSSSVEGLDRESYVENYFIGNDPARWSTGIGVFQSVVYHDLYDGIDMKVYTASNAMKYDFIVRPGAKASDISMSYRGVDDISIRNGNIIVHTSVLDIVELRPYAYQMIDDRQKEVPAHYRLKDGKISFAMGDYDTSLPLIIDPYLHFSTYTGSTADNWGTTGCFDSYKNTYTSGLVFGSGYPVSLGAYDGTFNGNCDIGIFKFDSSGSIKLYATYMGGGNADMPHSMYVNSFDQLVIFGTTGSSNFPVTPDAYDTSFNGGTSLQYEGSTTINFPNGVDLFISRFSQDGSQLQASTYVGGSGNDGLNYRNFVYPDEYALIMMGNDSLYFNYGDGARGEIITDDLNNIYVGSTTTSTNFPVSPNCIQSFNKGRQEGIVFKIDYNLKNLMWSTYLGGIKDDAIYSIDCDNEYNVLVTGGTNSLNFPTTAGSYRPYYSGGSADAFVTKIDCYGTVILASTLFGSATYDQSYFVRCGKNNDAFIFGQTKAAGSTLIHNANYNTPNSGQFLARFKPNLDTLVWSTTFGDGSGEPNISPTAFAVDICNRIYLSGWGRIFLGRSMGGNYYSWNTHGTSNLTVTSDAYQSVTDGQDFYIMSLDVDANNLVYATYFGEQHNSDNYYSGGDHVDGGTSRFDRLGTLYQSVCASCSGGDSFPVTTGAFGQHNNSTNCNNAIFRLNLTDDFPVAEFPPLITVCAQGNNVPMVNTGRGDSFLWIFDDSTTHATTSTQSFYHHFDTPGLHDVTLIAYKTGGCKPSDTLTRQIMILGNGRYSIDTLETCPGIPLQIGVRPTLNANYHWISGNVSDSTIANPYVTQSGVYTLVISQSDAPCFDTVDQVVMVGEANATISGDTLSCSDPTVLTINSPGSNNTYQWSSNRQFTDTLNSNMHQSNFSFHPDSSQWLYVHVVDNLGCEKDDSIHVNFYRVMDSLDVVDPQCPGDCSGRATVHSTSLAATPFNYHWGNGWTGDSTCTTLCAGNHTVYFRDGNGCIVVTPFTMTDPLPPVINATIEHIHCHETCTGSITVDVTGNSTYSLLWIDDSSTTTVRDSLCSGTYILQVVDSTGCIFFDTFEILDHVDIDIDISLLRNSCPDLCNGSAIATASGGTEPYSYLWSSGEEGDNANQLCEGTAFVVVTDAYGCQSTDSINIDRQHSFDSIEVWADDTVIFSGHSTTLHVTEIPYGEYYWSPSVMLAGASTSHPQATPLDTTTFVVTVTDSAGCLYNDSLTIFCISVNCGKPNIRIPNAFTPNNDGKNDMLCFSGEWIQEFHITIFTRWGEKIYESDDITECWDGRYKNNWCMPGVYVYYCTVLCQDGQTTQLKGDVTVIR